MNNRYTVFLTFFCCLSFYAAQSGPGDSTTVFAHNNVTMASYGNYDEQVVFPDNNTTYRKVLMTYTLGCPSGGCSDWDYTTQIFFRNPTGTYDTTIARIDTLSTMPLVIDTTWQVNEILQNMELGRVITPYGGYMANNRNGFNNNWSHRYYFDVTDYVHLLKDTCAIRAFYAGWSSGFSVSLRFDFIEGTPPRDIIDIQNLYTGSKNYTSSSDFESTYFTPKTVNAPSNAASARIYSTITGHGFNNGVNCAEFCQRQYDITTNGTSLANALIWKDDCGSNPIYPQGGTWAYDRAGWCPGSKGDIHEFEWTTFNPGASNTVDFNLQNYTWSGTQAPSYSVDAHVVFYGANNHTNDVELLDIIAPSTHEEHSRQNPFCGNPIIRVKNLGSATLTTFDVEYGLSGAGRCSYTWTGNLAFLEEATIKLPTLQWQGANPSDPTFTAEITSINGGADEFPYDNSQQSTYELPDVFTLPFLLLGVQTNNFPGETSYRLTDKDGGIIFQRTAGSMSANTLYKDTIYLSDGCYTLTVEDTGGDGLQWWANTAQGAGHVRFYNPVFTFLTLRDFQADFGNEFHYSFVWNSIDSVQSACNVVLGTSTLPEANQLTHSVYPNPTTGLCTVEIGSRHQQNYTCTLYNSVGIIVQQQQVPMANHTTLHFDLSKAPAGIYWMAIRTDSGQQRMEKIVVSR